MMTLDKEKDYVDIMEVIDLMEGHIFENFCAELLEKNGFRDVTVTRGSGDYGVDITARYHNRIYGIQCKRYATTVGINAVRDALGGYDYYNCDIVAVLTNSTFTPQAVTQANISGVKLWDRKSLVEFVDNCEELDFVKKYKENGSLSIEARNQGFAEDISTRSRDNFNKGRQGAGGKVRQQRSSSRTTQQQYMRNTSLQQKKKGTCWQIFLWVFFFPIMITIFLVKTDKLKLPAKIVLIVTLWIFFIIVGMNNDSGNENDMISDSVNAELKIEKESNEKEDAFSISDVAEAGKVPFISDVENSKIIENSMEISEGIRNENLNGRGRAAEYINVIGYVVAGYDQNYTLEHTDNFQNLDLWVIPTYEPDKQFWNVVEGVVIPHKTEVIVREQILSHEGYGAYSGYLLVEELEGGEQYYINVMNFETKPYWTYNDDLREAALAGDFIAVYHQISDYYPVSNDGSKAEIADGKVVLVKGVAGLSRYVNPDETGIDAVVWQEWKLGYGDVTIHFNADDLTIIY